MFVDTTLFWFMLFLCTYFGFGLGVTYRGYYEEKDK